MNLTDILKGALGVYRRHPGRMFLVAAPSIPLTVAGILVRPESWVLAVVILPIAFMVFYAVPAAALVRAVADALESTAPDFWRSYAAVVSRLGPLMLAALRFSVIIQALSIIIVGTPLAFYLLVRWLFFQHAIMLEDARAGASLNRSGDLVTGSWWRVFGITLVILIIVWVPGAFVGLLLFKPVGGFGLGLLSAPPGIGATAAAITGAITLPFAVSADTILFFDLRRRRARAAIAVA